MIIEQVDIHSIHGYEFNNRVHSDVQIAQIADSIKTFGFTQPIVIDQDDEVIIGHGRLAAARKLKLLTVPCVRLASLSDVQKSALRIVDNKLQNDSLWNFNNLDLELGFLEDNGFDLDQFGLDSLRFDVDTPQPETAAEPEEQKEETSKLITCPACEHTFDAKNGKKRA